MCFSAGHSGRGRPAAKRRALRDSSRFGPGSACGGLVYSQSQGGRNDPGELGTCRWDEFTSAAGGTSCPSRPRMKTEAIMDITKRHDGGVTVLTLRGNLHCGAAEDELKHTLQNLPKGDCFR